MMKRLLAAIVLIPGAALAHGAHPPVPEAAHGAAHAGPLVGLALIAVALGVGWLSARRRD